MSELRFVTDYKMDDQLRLSFNALAKETFGIEFEKWYQSGCWRDVYKCYSLADGDDIVVNLSTSQMQMIIKGTTYTATQVGTVMTKEGYRGQGNNSLLMKMAIEDNHDRDLMFLFADASAIPYYEKYGFKPYTMSTYALKGTFVKGTKLDRVKKLSMNNEEDRSFLETQAIKARRSSGFDVVGEETIMLWYAVNFYDEMIQYIPDLDTIVIGDYDEDEKTYELIRVYSETSYNLEEILTYVLPDEAKTITFQFTPDDGKSYIQTKDADAIFIRSEHTFGDFDQYPVVGQA